MGCGASVEGAQPPVASSQGSGAESPTSVLSPRLGGKTAYVAAIRHRPEGHPSYCALNLAWLTGDFLMQHPEISRTSMSTSAVVKKIVLPATEKAPARGGCFADAVERAADGSGSGGSGGGGGVVSRGRAFFQVSHAWSAPLSATLLALQEHFSPARQALWRPGHKPIPMTEVFVWLDAFSVPQRGTKIDDALAWHADAADDAAGALLLLDAPDCCVLRGMWPLYEAWCAARKGRQVGAGRLRLVAWGVDLRPLRQQLSELDLRSAEAPSDVARAAMHAAVEAGATLKAATTGVRAALADGACEVAAAAADGPRTPDKWAALNQAALLCEVYGFYARAEPLYVRVLQSRERVLGVDHPDTAASATALGLMLQRQGRLHEAEPLLRRALQSGDLVLGSEHPETLAAVANLAALLQEQGKLRDAEPLARTALRGRERALGPNHRETLTSASQLARLLQVKGQYDEAEPLAQRALEGRIARFGKQHHDTLEAQMALAGLLQESGRLKEAEALLRDCLKLRETTLGREHPDTLSTAKALAELLQTEGKTSDADALLARLRAADA